MFYNDKPIGVELPPSVVLTVTETIQHQERHGDDLVQARKKQRQVLSSRSRPSSTQAKKIKVNTDDGAYIERCSAGELAAVGQLYFNRVQANNFLRYR